MADVLLSHHGQGGCGTKNEWLGLLEVAGLEVEALYGGFDREPVNDESHEFVFVATRGN
ncbi:MAG: hypothetical protein ACRDNY_13615 [Gaiellaceae bacterium]